MQYLILNNRITTAVNLFSILACFLILPKYKWLNPFCHPEYLHTAIQLLLSFIFESPLQLDYRAWDHDFILFLYHLIRYTVDTQDKSKDKREWICLFLGLTLILKYIHNSNWYNNSSIFCKHIADIYSRLSRKLGSHCTFLPFIHWQSILVQK